MYCRCIDNLVVLPPLKRIDKMKKQNCINCKHKQWEPNECEYSSIKGRFVCDKREETIELISNMKKESYIEKAKVCCDLV